MIVPLDLPENLVKRLEDVAKASGISFRDLMLEALQSAVQIERRAVSLVFTQRVHDFGTHLESPWTALSELETESYTSAHEK